MSEDEKFDDQVAEILSAFSKATLTGRITAIQPDERRREPVMSFANSIEPLMSEGFKRGELNLIVTGSDQGRSIIAKHLEVEHAIEALGAVLYRYSPRYDYDGADRRDAMREAREIVTKALKEES